MDPKLYAAVAVVLLLLMSVGAREVHWKREITQVTIERDQVKQKLDSETLENSTLQRRLHEAMSTIKKHEALVINGQPVFDRDGHVVYEDVEESSTTQDETEDQQVKSDTVLHSTMDKLAETQSKLKEMESKVTKSSPLWNILAGWEPISQGWYAGAGLNAGPVSLSVDNPVALAFRPRLSAMIRF